MKAIKIVDGVYSLRANHWDRRLFDELIPLPDGTSYNSYLVIGDEKTALIDTVDFSKTKEFLDLLRELKEKMNLSIDYVIANHAEQDHSGSIPDVLEMFPQAKVVTNAKCKEFLMDLLHIPEDKFVVISEGDKLDLGGKTLEFIMTPWVHWPETMTTYLIEDKIAFTCDFFGSHRATSHLFPCDEAKVLEDAKRYYAEIMMPFRVNIRSNLKKLEAKEIRFIAPSHGPVYNRPEVIMEAYKSWVSDEVIPKVIIAYTSMHGSTEEVVRYLVDRFTENNLVVIPFNLTVEDIGKLAMELVDASTLIFASPYVLAGLHPNVVYAIYLINALRPKVKYVGLVSSYGWGGMGVNQFKEMWKLKTEILEPILIKGLPRKEDYEKLENLVDQVLKRNLPLMSALTV